MRACYCGSVKGVEPVSLRKTLKNICKKIHTSFTSDIKAGSCTTDPDLVRRGDVFFALPEFDEELDEMIGLAIHHGCSAVVTNKPSHGAESVPFFIVPNVADGFAHFCHSLYDYPAKSLKMIGITGTSGKTSTSYLIAGVLAEAGYQVGLIGSLGIFDGHILHPTSNADLTPDQLAKWLHTMTMNGCTHAVVESSSKSIVKGYLSGINFDAVCLTNIRRDHIDFHGTVEQYRRAKLGIFKYAKKKALAVCNVDDKITGAILPLIDHPLLSTGIRNQAEVNSILVERFPNEQTFILTAGTNAVPICTKIIGDEHIYNCMIATALGIGFDIDMKTVARGIERVESVPSRMERIECGQPFNVFIDSARTSDSLNAILKTTKEITTGRLICVFGAAEYHDPAKRTQLGKSIGNMANSVILTTASNKLEPETIATICEVGKVFANSDEVQIMPDRAEAIAWALSEAQPGDTVLIIGRGETEYLNNDIINKNNKNQNQKFQPFCDRFFTRQWLNENQICTTAF
ncbi:MAG: UDP-N-acetylmuramyl-tripeptide synthetase [Planctomycetaceae bacterium]|jgi:UDP-N-acetylmuramoyl-L-alanyl-D-glutamate--2,6-diaminopimelate ligase|nr:UDP-N-acetylmuramyl-tripeptide synthetase [Planctomycetaceae bacterium]